MCRFIAYLGKQKQLLKAVLKDPENSLISQSRHDNLGLEGLNADGFGVAWYNFDVDPNPGIFKSTQPAWNDSNLIHLASKILSNCFLAHIRASTIGDVAKSNCHPFEFEKYSFVHNGTIYNFNKFRRDLVNELDDDLFLKIRGSTDSECIFYLILQHLRKKNTSLEQAVIKVIEWVLNKQKNLSEEDYSLLNFAITDGTKLMATRFASKKNMNLSLYYQSNGTKNCSSLMIASEPLDNIEKDWYEIEENSYIIYDKNELSFKVDKLIL